MKGGWNGVCLVLQETTWKARRSSRDNLKSKTTVKDGQKEEDMMSNWCRQRICIIREESTVTFPWELVSGQSEGFENYSQSKFSLRISAYIVSEYAETEVRERTACQNTTRDIDGQMQLPSSSAALTWPVTRRQFAWLTKWPTLTRQQWIIFFKWRSCFNCLIHLFCNFFSSADLSKEFDDEPESISVHLGDVAMFACHIGGAPKPDVKWYKDELEIDTEHVNYRYTLSLYCSFVCWEREGKWSMYSLFSQLWSCNWSDFKEH